MAHPKLDITSLDLGATSLSRPEMHDALDVSQTWMLATSYGVRDLSTEIQSLDFPAASGVISFIWGGSLRDHSQVAVKLQHYVPNDVDSESVLRKFIREARVWFRASHHENIMPLLGIARLRGTVAFVSPWMKEGDLSAYLEAHPDANIKQLLADVARALAYLHSQNIVYCNLSWTTILVSDLGRAYLSSFLMAHSLLDNDYLPSYALYEQKLFEQEVLSDDPIPTFEDDVSDFGALIEFLSEYRYPHTDTESWDLSRRTERLGAPNQFPEELLILAKDCLQESPLKRPTMDEVAGRISQFAEASYSKLNVRTFEDISSEIKNITEHPIAGGGYCDLYLGERLGSGQVALKLVRFLDPTEKGRDTARHRFLKEAHLWAELQHPRILEFHGICQHGPTGLFMVSPYLKQGNIVQYLSNGDPDVDRYRLVNMALFSLCDTIDPLTGHQLLQTAEGLSYLHYRQPPVVHGDIKGANILINESQTAVLADFGLSKLVHETTTTKLQGAGSLRWMAPELLLAGNESLGPLKTRESDVYAYGHLMLEVLSNKLPFFNVREDIRVIMEVINGRRSSRPNGSVADMWLTDAAWAVSQTLTAIDPGERPGINTVVVEMYDLCERTGVSPA